MKGVAQTTKDLKNFYAIFNLLNNVAEDKLNQVKDGFCKRLEEWVPAQGLPRFHKNIMVSKISH